MWLSLGVYSCLLCREKETKIGLIPFQGRAAFPQSPPLLPASLCGAEGGWLGFFTASSIALGDKNPEQIVHRLKPNTKSAAPGKSPRGHFSACPHRLLPWCIHCKVELIPWSAVCLLLGPSLRYKSCAVSVRTASSTKLESQPVCPACGPSHVRIMTSCHNVKSLAV